MLFDDNLLQELEDASNSVPGTCFRCDMLVDCSCAEACDWNQAFVQRHDVSDATFKNEMLLAYDPKRKLLGVPYSVVCRNVVRQQICSETNEEEVGVCSLHACYTKLPPHDKGGWTATFTCGQRGKQQWSRELKGAIGTEIRLKN